MTAEQLLITKANTSDITHMRQALLNLIAVHNKLVYHIFNSPESHVIEAALEPAPIMVKPSRFDHPAFEKDDRSGVVYNCRHDYDLSTMLCKFCGEPYEKDDDNA